VLLKEFDYYLPGHLIAQHPHQKRDEAKLLIYQGKTIFHKQFFNIIDYLKKDDILVLNNTKILSSRILGEKKETGAKIEILLTEKLDDFRWKCLFRPAKRLKEGSKIILKDKSSAFVEFKDPNGEENIIVFEKKWEYQDLTKIGYIPLPPYIKRDYKNYSKKLEKEDNQYYQTVFAKQYGSVASPTAGLHFSETLLSQIKNKGVKIVYVTLNISLGTFKPVKEKNIEDHQIHSEKFFLPQETADVINNKKGRVIAVGTTATRVLETVAQQGLPLSETKGISNLYIYPPFKFKVIDGLITNFHLPKSTLLMLVSAFIGLENTKKIYKEAIKKEYLFFSYGDAMMLLPEEKPAGMSNEI